MSLSPSWRRNRQREVGRQILDPKRNDDAAAAADDAVAAAAAADVEVDIEAGLRRRTTRSNVEEVVTKMKKVVVGVDD